MHMFLPSLLCIEFDAEFPVYSGRKCQTSWTSLSSSSYTNDYYWSEAVAVHKETGLIAMVVHQRGLFCTDSQAVT